MLQSFGVATQIMNGYVGASLVKTISVIRKERKENIKLVSMVGEWFLRTSST